LLSSKADDPWMGRYNELVQYRDQRGNCSVPNIYEENKQLGHWVNTQRVQYKRYKEDKSSHMTQDRIKMLEELKFDWNPRETTWMAQFAELMEYVRVHGPGSIPSQKANSKLHKWAYAQRKQKLEQNKTLTKERIDRLDSISFPWTDDGPTEEA
jgi:hypothetical protein